MLKEGRNVEFKEKWTRSFLKTISAFANYDGGRIIFGINDEGEVVGLNDPDALCLNIENAINDTISPSPDYSFSVDTKKKLVTLTVEPGLFKPYLYNSKAYKRNGTSTVEVDRVEMSRLILEGKNLGYDEVESAKRDLQFSYLREKLEQILNVKDFSDDILKTLGLYTKTDKYNNGAALLADQNDFPGLDMVRFGENIDYIMDRETFSKMSILKQYDSAIILYRKYYQYEVIDGASRRQIETVPEKAFREAIANALVHRTWDVPNHIKVEMFDDRIDIISPGGLPNRVKEEDYLRGKVSFLRNPVIGDVFFRLRMIERYGTGIRRILRAYQDSAQKPYFEIFENDITVSLPVVNRKELTGDDLKAYHYFVNGKSASVTEMAEFLGCGKSKARKILQELVQKGYLRVSGAGRSTRYQI